MPETDSWRTRRESGVLTCSASKRSYRDIIIDDRPDVTLVYPRGPRDLIRRRMASRYEHFMLVACRRHIFIRQARFEFLAMPPQWGMSHDVAAIM